MTKPSVAAATPGPWTVENCYDGGRTVAIVRNPDSQCCINATADAVPRGYDATHANAALIVEAVNAYRSDEMERLRDALETLLSVYVALVNSGDCGFWNPEEQPEVIQARAALAPVNRA